MDLTGATVTAQLRSRVEKSTVAATFTVTVTDAAAGELTLSLADTVTDVDGGGDGRSPTAGNGFSFGGADEGSLDAALRRALAMHRDRPAEWAALVSRNMGEDVGWGAAAGEYVGLYEGGLVRK